MSQNEIAQEAPTLGDKAFASSGVVMARDRAYDYIRFHVEAFRCPTPLDNISELLKKHYDMTAIEIDELITGMVDVGDIFYHEGTFFGSGYVATVDK